MASSPSGLQAIGKHKLEEMDCNKLNTDSRSVLEMGRASYVNVTEFAEKLHGIEPGDEVEVITVPEGIFIPIDDDE